MDKLKGMAGGDKKQESSGSAGKQDYGDKGLEAAQKKMGMEQSRETNEKITDGAREQFEKRSGKDVPDKLSN